MQATVAAWTVLGLLGVAHVVLAVVVLVGDTRAGRTRRTMLLLLAVAGSLAAAGALAGLLGDVPTAHRLWVLGALLPFPLALTLYPTGRLAPGLGWLSLVPFGTLGVLAQVYPTTYGFAIGPVTDYLLLILLGWWRYARAADDSDERRSLLWWFLGWGAGGIIAGLAAFAIGGWAAAVPILLVCLGAVVCLGIGLLAPGYGDVRRLLVEAVVQATAVIVVLTCWVTVLSGLELALGHRPTSPGGLGLLVAGLAMAYAPVVTVLRGVIDLMLFGDRRAPLAAVTEVGASLGEGPAKALDSLRVSLALPYAALVDAAGEPVASSGEPSTRVVDLPLRPDDPASGTLQVGLRVGDAVLPARDRQVLAVMGPSLAQLLHAQRLGAALEESRTQVIHAVEEERRRIRRDLHDGLGPRLTGVAYTADAARNVLGRGDTTESAALLASVRAEAGEAIAEVRRLVEGLRPPVLDQVGLAEALRQHAGTLRGRGGDRMAVEVDVAEPLGPLPAAVEVAAYRIAVEALTNAARHSGGTRCVVRLRRDGTGVSVEVSDDGTAGGGWTPGTGLTSMRERAEMLGGTFDAGTGRVRVTLPA